MAGFLLLTAFVLVLIPSGRGSRDRPTFPDASVDRDRARVAHDLLARRDSP